MNVVHYMTFQLLYKFSQFSEMFTECQSRVNGRRSTHSMKAFLKL